MSFLVLASPVSAQAARPSGTPPYKRLTETRLRSCEAREEAVKTRMNSLVRFSTNIEEKFDAIAQRVQNFYVNKVLPSGKSVANYDALVADIQAKKDIVTKDLADAKAKVDAFSCTTDDPKGLLTDFRLDMQKVKTDLKNYRSSIKNLIVAVRPLSPSPKPEETKKPEATATPTTTP